MKKAYYIFITLLVSGSTLIQAQSSKLTLRASKAQDFYNEVAQATLVIPITDKKDPEEKALLDAVKKYWTICPYKIMSNKIFSEMQKNHSETPPKTFYLLKETYERRKHKKKDWAYTKYYIAKQNVWVEEHDEPYIEFKLPLKTTDREPGELPCGYLFGLMIKQLNAELLLMKDKEAYSNSFSSKKLMKINFKHSLKAYAGKTLLVSANELENYMINLRDDDKDIVRQQKKLIKFLARKTKLPRSQIKMTSPDEIKTAIEKADTSTLIYTGFSVYNTQDAHLLRRIDPNRDAKPLHWVVAVGCIALVFGVTLALSGVL